MPESFEKHFAKKPEEPKSPSPEKTREEKALELARQIMTIMRKPPEEKTIEDYQRIIELAKQIEALYEEKERDYEAEVKIIVANLEQALKQGANKNSVAEGLAGVGTPEAMALRKRLIKEGASKDSVARGLAGVGTPEAMALRERLIKEGATKDYYVAQGLAGVNTEEAEEFRKKYFADNPTLIAKSYSTGWPAYDGVICRYGYEK
jgi:hypothetical protein